MITTDTDSRKLQQKIDEYGDMLFKLSFVRLQNVQDAEDVVQEVFYQYVKNIGSFQDPEHEKAWLLKVTVNACRKVWRSAWRRRRREWNPEDGRTEETGQDGICREAQSTMPGPEETAFRREENRCLMSAVMALPAKYRDVIHLFYYEELSVKEIARITGRVESTVTSQLTRGRELLRKSLKGEYDFD
ncbi:sigma-70 family RNA polymerase sigma factor [Acetatifactor muris]|nr:sigma-70 family RNA polymerase sigma factor [Acetatifactor muris]MCR2046337.1 sigma-70 family RNA polymerase sigma factor [Acetatifactor muris]